LSIRLLERACVDYSGSTKDPTRYSVAKKNKHIAIIGGGISGSSCALELVRKGYEVCIFEKSERLGGRLWDMDLTIMPTQVILDDMAQLEQSGITIQLDKCIVDLDHLHYDAVYVATGKEGDTLGLELENEKIKHDPVSLASSRDGVFVGGSNIADQDLYSPIQSVAQGGRAARSIERYIQKASLSVGRKSEGILNTRLYTDIQREERKPLVIPQEYNDHYTEKEAIAEASRCMLCECMECVKTCDFLAHFNQYPKKYLRDISKTVTALQGIRSKMIATRIINSCSLCGLCAEICPNDLDMGEVCLDARRSLVKAETMPPTFYEFWIRDMLFSNDQKISLYKNQPGSRTSKYLFFPGCQMGSSFPGYVEKVYRYLIERLDGEVGLAVACCGAPAEWSGRKELHKDHLQSFLNHWEELGRPQVILACCTCQKMFDKYLSEVPVKSLWNLMDEMELPLSMKSGAGASIALYDPCSSRYYPEIQESIRKLLRKLDYVIEELPLNRKFAQCCSFGGLISTVNPSLAQKITEHRINASPYNYVTYCSNCRDDFAGKGKPTWHMLDLLFDQAPEKQALRRPPSYSQRRENRIFLKEHLLENIWGEKMKIIRDDYETINLLLSHELECKLEKEFILLDEIKQVIHYAESTGYRLINAENKHLIAHLQVGIITYWVEYYPADADNGYYLFNAYSHRIQIVEVANNERA